MSDPLLSNMYFKNKMAWVRTTLKIYQVLGILRPFKHQTDGDIEDSLEKLLEISNCDEPPSYEEVTRNPPPFNLEPLSPPIPPSRNLKPRPIRADNSPTNNQSEVPPKPDLPDFLLEAELNFESNRFRQLEGMEYLNNFGI